MPSDTLEVLELDAIARLCAELDVTSEPESVLPKHGITTEAWPKLQEDLFAGIADDVDRGDLERAERFRVVYGARRTELLGDESAPIDATAPAGKAATQAYPAAATATPPDLPVQASFQLEPAPLTAPELDPDATAMVDSRAVIAGLQNRAVPFDLSAPSSPLPPVKEITDEQSGQTQLTDARDIRAMLAARGIAIGPDTIPPAPQPAPPPAVSTAAVDVDATAEIDNRHVLVALRERGILPFEKDAQAMPPTPSPPQDQSGDTTIAPSKRSTEAMHLTDFQAQVAARMAKDPALAPLPIPLGQFAVIQAALSKSKDRDGVVRYHNVDVAAWKAISAQMGAALSASAGLRARYEELYREAMKS